MSDPVVQKGGAVTVGFNSNIYSGFYQDTANRELVGDVKWILDNNAAAVTALISNPGFKLVISGVVMAAGTEITTLTAIVRGDALTINTVAMFVEDVKIDYEKLDAKCTLTLIKYASMTHS